MTETIIKEPVEGEPGATEPPAQPPSEPPAEPSAVDEASLKAILEPLVQAEVEKIRQSVKDKRFSKHEDRIDSIEDTLAEFKELQADGMSEKQALQHMKVNEFLASQGQETIDSTPPPEEPAVQPTVAPDALLSSVLNLAGLDSTDADVIEIMRANPDNPATQAVAINQLVETRKQKPPLTPGAALPSGGGKAVESDTLDSLSKRLNELVDLPMQTPESEAERAEIREKINKIDPIRK